jgi:lysophospholipase L1-like esterase
MGDIVTAFSNAFRDFKMDGVDSSGRYKPEKAAIRTIGLLIEAAISRAGLGSLVDVMHPTELALDADLAHDANTVALVYADPTSAKNDLYLKTGASGAGAWNNTGALHSIITSIAQPSIDAAQAAAALAQANGLAFYVDAPVNDDGIIPIEIDQDGRILRGVYANGTPFNPQLFVDAPMDDSGLKPFLISDDTPPRVLSGVYPDGTPFPSTVMQGQDVVYPNDDRLLVSDYAQIAERSAARLRFIRPLADGQGFEHCAPGARVSFYTRAPSVTFEVYFNALVIRDDARNYKAKVFVDGADAGTIEGTAGPNTPQEVSRSILLGPSQLRKVELVWPYGDGMDLNLIRIPAGFGLGAAEPRPQEVIITVGNSITQGYTGDDVSKTWSFILANELGRTLINGGYGGRTAVATDGTWAGQLAAPHGANATIVYMIGVNNCIAQSSLTAFMEQVAGFIANARAEAPLARIIVVSPFYCPAIEANTIPLDSYRTKTQEAVDESGDANVEWRDGKLAMANNPELFVGDLVHPNSLGHAAAGAGLAAMI